MLTAVANTGFHVHELRLSIPHVTVLVLAQSPGKVPVGKPWARGESEGDQRTWWMEPVRKARFVTFGTMACIGSH